MGRSDPPKQLGAYELLGLLATGGMAEVFLARKRVADGAAREGTVVIKRVLPHLARQKAFHDMFLDEARIVSRIAHPNVVSMHELCDLSAGDPSESGGGDELFLVMEHLHGESLSALAKQLRKSGTPIPLDVALHVGVAAAAGLHAAHELKNEAGRSLDIVHRDVSPQNLFVLYSGEVKVIDFGIAKAAERQAGHTQTGHVKGKFAYMPPEQIGAQQVDRRVDVFALGVVLHELVTGQRLFEREHDLLVLKAICEDPIPLPSARRADVPPEIDAVIMKALERSRDKRFATAEEMRAALEAARAALPRADGDATTRLAALMRSLFADRIARQRDLIGAPPSGPGRAPLAPGEASSPGPGPNTDPSLSNPLPRTPPSPSALADVVARPGAPPILESSPPSGVERSDVGQAISIAGASPVGDATRPKRGRWIALGAAVATAAAVGLVLALRGTPESASGAMAPPSAAGTLAPTLDAKPTVASTSTAVTSSAAAPSSTTSSAATSTAVGKTPPTVTSPPGSTPPTTVAKPTATPTAPKPKPTSTGFTRFE